MILSKFRVLTVPFADGNTREPQRCYLGHPGVSNRIYPPPIDEKSASIDVVAEVLFLDIQKSTLHHARESDIVGSHCRPVRAYSPISERRSSRHIELVTSANQITNSQPVGLLHTSTHCRPSAARLVHRSIRGHLDLSNNNTPIRAVEDTPSFPIAVHSTEVNTLSSSDHPKAAVLTRAW